MELVNQHPMFWMKHPSHHWDKQIQCGLKNQEHIKLKQKILQNTTIHFSSIPFSFNKIGKTYSDPFLPVSALKFGETNLNCIKRFFLHIYSDFKCCCYCVQTTTIVGCFKLLKCLQYFFFVDIPSK